MGIKRNEVQEPQWTEWDYAELIKHDLFSSELWKETMDWNTILEHVKRMESACQLINRGCPARLFRAFADLLEANLYILDDLFYFFTGIRIGSGEGLGIILAFSQLRFWNMGFYKEMEEISIGLDKIKQHFLACLPSSSESGGNRSYVYAYAYAAYEGGEEDKEQVKNIIGFLDNYKTLTYSYDKTIEFAKLNGLVAQYRQSKKGQEFIKPWRRDFAGSRDNLIAKLEKDPKLGLWVNKCTHLREDEDAVVQLFCDDIGFLADKDESCNVDNWLAILNIVAVLQEYDEQHAQPTEKLVRRAKATSPFTEFIIDTPRSKDVLRRLHEIIDGKKPKICALTILAAVQNGILMQPTYKALFTEFPEIGERKNYRYYLQRRDNYSDDIDSIAKGF